MTHKHSWKAFAMGVVGLKRTGPSTVTYTRSYTDIRCQCGKEKRAYHKDLTEFNK